MEKRKLYCPGGEIDSDVVDKITSEELSKFAVATQEEMKILSALDITFVGTFDICPTFFIQQKQKASFFYVKGYENLYLLKYGDVRWSESDQIESHYQFRQFSIRSEEEAYKYHWVTTDRQYNFRISVSPYESRTYRNFDNLLSCDTLRERPELVKATLTFEDLVGSVDRFNKDYPFGKKYDFLFHGSNLPYYKFTFDHILVLKSDTAYLGYDKWDKKCHRSIYIKLDYEDIEDQLKHLLFSGNGKSMNKISQDLMLMCAGDDKIYIGLKSKISAALLKKALFDIKIETTYYKPKNV